MAEFVDDFSDLQEIGIDAEASNDNLTLIFNKAAKHLQTLVHTVDNQTLLSLYGYYKQAIDGPCLSAKPSWYDIKSKSKWEAWHKLGSMRQNEAKDLYIKIIQRIDPNFNVSTDPIMHEQWVKVSSLQNKESTPVGDKTVIDLIKECDVKEVETYLKNNELVVKSIDELDNEGLALIHWAADSGFVNIIEVLIKQGANVDVLDVEGQTALHYASSCGHIDAVRFLLEKGAKCNIKDNEGNMPSDVASDDAIKGLLCFKE